MPRAFASLLIALSLFIGSLFPVLAGPVEIHQRLSRLQDERDEKALQQAVTQLFGKSHLMKGRVPPKIEKTTALWATMSSTPAVVVKADGTLLGEMISLGDDGLQVLTRRLPNFSQFNYRIESQGRTLLGGGLKIEHYDMPPEHEPDSEVPEGSLESFEWNESTVFPNTQRRVTVYLPAGFDRSRPAPLMVFQDGTRHADRQGQLRAPVVMDHLINRGQMPPAVGVFIDPGRKKGQKPDQKPANRGFEYDSLGSAYVTFLTTEILPEVERRFDLTFTKDPRARAIGGGSSGGICAFTAAWERPDAFHKVLSWVGSFVDLRGGDAYPYLVRTTEAKPIRVYLLGGENDLDNPFGHWPTANQKMAAALDYMDYDFRLEWTSCFHGSKGMSAHLPEALRWLWRDWKTDAKTASVEP